MDWGNTWLGVYEISKRYQQIWPVELVFMCIRLNCITYDCLLGSVPRMRDLQKKIKLHISYHISHSKCRADSWLFGQVLKQEYVFQADQQGKKCLPPPSRYWSEKSVCVCKHDSLLVLCKVALNAEVEILVQSFSFWLVLQS